ncbi:MAG TPA: GNAT family N-acetyltransferase, partial [Verrucomicrobiae bacterium]|nr:GNAT family N-acetyltransferase [Verrucomicrobiae bacterium]
THKTEVGGVRLDLRNASAVRRAWREIESSVTKKAGREHFAGVTVEPMISDREGYELILGSSLDEQFGPVLLFGLGGQLVEVFRDRALALPPLNVTLARRMMEQTRVYGALKGVRGRETVDLGALEQLLVRFSRMVVEQSWIKEIDINPLLVSPRQLVALDVRMLLHGPGVKREQLPKLAIRPYPVQYVNACKLKDGAALTLRPIRPEDEPLIVQFHKTLSEESVYYRYFSPLKLSERIAHERLTRICFTDYDREIILVANHQNPKTSKDEIVGVGGFRKLHGLNEAEFAIVISDAWQGRGLGTQLLNLLVQVGRDEKLARITASILPDNHAMQQVCRKAGFIIHHLLGEPECSAEIIL